MKWMIAILPHVVWIGGIVVFVIGLQYVPDIMPDEVPPQSEDYYRKEHLVSNIGLLLFLSGLGWVVARWLYRHAKK